MARNNLTPEDRAANGRAAAARTDPEARRRAGALGQLVRRAREVTSRIDELPESEVLSLARACARRMSDRP